MNGKKVYSEVRASSMVSMEHHKNITILSYNLENQSVEQFAKESVDV